VTPNDANGSIPLEGSFQSFSFTALWNTCGASACPTAKIDGFTLQLGVESVPEPGSAALLALGICSLGLAGASAGRRTR
jgi:hypothetical protein